tara:strand:+ start:219 stop:1070 length:852 start_codon:yes stop_codon:yes gene_type:complete
MKKINKNEKGFTLVLSLVLLMVMSLMGGSLIVISSGDHQSNNTSDEYQQAFYVAETALLEGEKQLINSYMGPWVDVDKISVAKPAAGASDEENKKYEDWVTLQNKLNPSEVNTLQPDGESLTESHARNIDGRGMPKNSWDSWEDVSTDCKESFRNLSEPTTGEVQVTHQPVMRSFYDLIKPIFSNKTDIDSTVYKKRDGTVKNITDIIKKEEDFLKRFYYEYFSINIGTASYIGTGSSIKKTASDSQSLGTAYKIYGCGIFMNKAMTKNEIIIPLETVIVMPN